MLRNGLRFVAGAAIATVLWIYATPMYNQLIARVAQPILSVDPRLDDVEVIRSGRRLIARGGAGQPYLPGVVIPADELTYNIILLAGLFATNPAPFRDRSIRWFGLSLLILFATHVIAAVASIEVTLATSSAWGLANYSAIERGIWKGAEFGYRLVGMFGIAFACWWMTRTTTRRED